MERITKPTGEVGIRLNFHPGQQRAWASDRRIVAVIAGGRSGKTAFGAWWVYRQMQLAGPGDGLVVAPSYPLLDKAAVPEVQAVLQRTFQLGVLKRSPLQFIISPEGAKRLWGYVPEREPRILFAHATNPEGLEAMSAKWAWLDEAGQAMFKLASYEAVFQRLAIDQGRCLITTKPFNLGWLKQKIYDPWEQHQRLYGRPHPEIEVINYGSADNPAFPPEELERARRELPAWKLRMHYYGLFERPAGLIYDCFDRRQHTYDPFPIPPEWRRYGGIDFGGVNTAAVMLAEHPQTKQLYLYRHYLGGGQTAADHAAAIRHGEPMTFCTWVGGSGSEGQWRMEFTKAGMHVSPPPIADVEVGINRVYALFKTGRLLVSKKLEHLLSDLESYSRPVDEQGEPLPGIVDKSSYHLLDALRYIGTRLAVCASEPRIVVI